MSRFVFWVKLVHYHVILAYVVAGLFCALTWAYKGEIPPSGGLQLACVSILTVWFLNGRPHFGPAELRMVTVTSPLRLLFLFGMVSLTHPSNKEGYMLALALFSLLTTYDIVRGRVFN